MADQKIMDAAWRSYAEQVLPFGASDVQRQESRRAFYAGAQSLFGGILTMLDPGEEPTDADLAKMDAVQAELSQFADDIQAGRA